MRIALTVTCLALGSALALAQVEAPAKPGDSQQSTGRTVSPETKGVQQPQGPTGPTETTRGGAPPESPQGRLLRACKLHRTGQPKPLLIPTLRNVPRSRRAAERDVAAFR